MRCYSVDGVNVVELDDQYWFILKAYCDNYRPRQSTKNKLGSLIHAGGRSYIRQDIVEFLCKNKFLRDADIYYRKYQFINVGEVLKSSLQSELFDKEFLTMITDKKFSDPIIYDNKKKTDGGDDDFMFSESSSDEKEDVISAPIGAPQKKLRLNFELATPIITKKPATVQPPPPPPAAAESIVVMPKPSSAIEALRVAMLKQFDDMQNAIINSQKTQLTTMAFQSLMNDAGLREMAIARIGEQVTEKLRAELTPVVRAQIRRDIASSVRQDLVMELTPIVKAELVRQYEPQIVKDKIAQNTAPPPDLSYDVSKYVTNFRTAK
jgi:hypothetical protein